MAAAAFSTAAATTTDPPPPDASERLLGRLVDLAVDASELYLPSRIPVLHAEPTPLQFYRE